jgi:formylglycine-generating enzyme required for sulfatase activity
MPTDFTLAQLTDLAQSRGLDANAQPPQLILALLEDGSTTPTERAALGRLLAQLGDPRPGVLTREVDWVDIPAGGFTIGSDLSADPEAKDRELPQHLLDLPAFKISRYPVTVAQYAQFVSDNGYAKNEYWLEHGARWKAERTHPDIGWDDPAFNVANQPVIGITWFEAQAYCRWLSAQLGTPVRLPSEAEWEKAARGTDGRIYPYGSELDESRFNCDSTQIGAPCAVGLFPANASPYGALDMCGNVFQWTSSLLRDYPYDAADGREDPNRNGSRIFRGGSWNVPAVLSRSAFRSHFYAHGAYDWVGFRVAQTASSSQAERRHSS